MSYERLRRYAVLRSAGRGSSTSIYDAIIRGSAVLKILIVEDDLMIADTIEEILVNNGYAVCGIGRTVVEAVRLGRLHGPDLAVVDLRLADGGLGTEFVAQFDASDRFGVLYASGNISQMTLTKVDGDACLSKPYSEADLLRSLAIVAEISGKTAPRGRDGIRSEPIVSGTPAASQAYGTARSAFPRGFHLLQLPRSHSPVP